MKKIRLYTVIAVLSVTFFSALAVAGTRDDCISKCRQAGAFIQSRNIDTAIKEIGNKSGQFVWNDGVSYVFLMDMNGKMIAHPHQPGLTKQKSLVNFTDSSGKLFFKDMIKTAQKGKGWTKYMWPVPGKGITKPKHTYIYRVPDTDYFVAAGFYVIEPGVFY